MSFVKYYLYFLLTSSVLVADSQQLANQLAERYKRTISCPGTVVAAQSKGEYKAAISELRALIEKKQTSELLLALSICQLKDQQEEEALKTFMLSLDKAYSKEGVKMSAREEAAYKELLPLYLANAQELDQKLETLFKNHSDYHHCQFLLAAKCANERRYEPFFYLFYQSYCSYPESHMAYKTQGVVASLILQRAKSAEEKEHWRKEALTHFQKAMQLCPEDTGLCRMMIFTATDKERKEVVRLVISHIIDTNSKIARGDIPFYINYALLVDEKELAERLLDKAKTWYEYSRIIQEMQTLISQHKAEK